MVKKLLYKLSGGFTILPFYLAINITNKCNRECNFCLFHSKYIESTEHDIWFRKQPKELSYLSFEKFLRRLGIFRKLIKSIAITGKGEPFLHKDLLKFCHLCEIYRTSFSITTNGDYLDALNIMVYLSFEYLTSIRISIYEKNNKLLSIKDKRIQFFNQTNEDIPDTIKGYTSQYKGIEIYCSMPKDFNKVDSCKAPFSFLTINTDETIVPCYSYNTTSQLSDSFWKIWNGKKIRKYRRDALRMKAQHTDCLNCGINEQ